MQGPRFPAIRYLQAIYNAYKEIFAHLPAAAEPKTWIAILPHPQEFRRVYPDLFKELHPTDESMPIDLPIDMKIYYFNCGRLKCRIHGKGQPGESPSKRHRHDLGALGGFIDQLADALDNRQGLKLQFLGNARQPQSSGGRLALDIAEKLGSASAESPRPAPAPSASMLPALTAGATQEATPAGQPSQQPANTAGGPSTPAGQPKQPPNPVAAGGPSTQPPVEDAAAALHAAYAARMAAGKGAPKKTAPAPGESAAGDAAGGDASKAGPAPMGDGPGGVKRKPAAFETEDVATKKPAMAVDDIELTPNEREMARCLATGAAMPRKERPPKRAPGSPTPPYWGIAAPRCIAQCSSGLKGAGQNKAFNYGHEPTQKDSMVSGWRGVRRKEDVRGGYMHGVCMRGGQDVEAAILLAKRWCRARAIERRIDI